MTVYEASRTPTARVFTAVEAGLGFGFLTLVIGYLPALNQSFSKGEVNTSLLDARAGSLPTSARITGKRAHGSDEAVYPVRLY